uniref:Peptidase A2 domain-containing protein n=1 Tax=Kalanchoe fedtschenkoi TaxID=63787 RepID=A0A7N1A7L2_KALFE
MDSNLLLFLVIYEQILRVTETDRKFGGRCSLYVPSLSSTLIKKRFLLYVLVIFGLHFSLRTIKWDEIPIPDQWILEKVGHPKIEVNEEVDEIIESSEAGENEGLQPQQPFKMEKEGQVVSFSAFAKICENETLNVTMQQINKIIEQNNYTNAYLNVLGEQIISLHERLNKLSQIGETSQPKITGKEIIVATPSLQPPPEITGYKLEPKSMLDLENLIEEKFKGLKISTLEEFTGQIESNHKNYKPLIQDEINKLYKYNNNPTYYNRPSPVDILHEEQEYILNNSYNGKNIYEWNLDGNKDEILTTIKQEDGRVIENAVYILVINIMEHFIGRVSDNNENIRTLLQNLRCKTLTNFRWYKDAFLNRVMELPECNSSHWKSKFIDGLPHLFAERVRKTLRKDMIAIPYDRYTYGELIKTCVQEGLSLCNEIRLNQQIKRQSLLERNQLGQFCSQFGMDIPTNSKGKGKYIPKEYKKPYRKKKRKYSEEKLVKKHHRKIHNKMNHKKDKKTHHLLQMWQNRMKDKIKNLNLDEELKDSLKKLLINSESETETETDSSGNTELGNLNETTGSEDDVCCSSCGKPCLKQDSEDEIYKLISQFRDNDSLNVLKGNDLIEFLQSIKDKELSETRQNEEISKIDSNPYMMSEVFKTLRKKQKIISETPTNVLDLKIEIDNLKDEIKMLKQLNNNLNQRVSKLEDKTPSDLINPNEPLEEGFLSVINMITAFKFHIKIKLLINNSFMIELIALIDSGADVSVIQEGLIPTKYFEKTTHSLRHAGGEKLQIDFKIPKAYICNNKVCIPESFLLVKNITNQVILGTPFLKQIFHITHIDDKYFEGTFQNKKVQFQFVTEPRRKS